MLEQIEFTFKNAAGQSGSAVKRTTDTAMRILILGDFGGRNNRGLGLSDNGKSAADRTIVQVDIDNFAAVISCIAPKLQLQKGNDTSPAVPIIFSEMEDFHPDTLFHKLEIFQGLSQLRGRLGNPAMEQQDAQRWQMLRHSPVAPWIGLALPRLLMRLPYGRCTDPVENFEFEEIPPTQEQQHQNFLWGNPAFYCALLIARYFSEQGWFMQLGDYLEIGELPAYIIKQHGESVLQPCAEVCLSDKAMEKILNQGIMPFISHRSSNIVRLPRFQSVAEPLKALAGPWS